MKTLLICHEGAVLDQEGLPRWLASFSDLVGIVVLEERAQRKIKRFRRELRRVGMFRFLDVALFRLYYRVVLARRDDAWQKAKLGELVELYPDYVAATVPILRTHSPNSREAEAFIRDRAPDVMIARCKSLLKKSVFSIPTTGTFVMHPGICPEYKNAHGCFWALANDDLDNVGMTLLKIDESVDGGPISGHYRYDYDEVGESHVVIQYRVVFDNLVAVQSKLLEEFRQEAEPVDIAGRASAMWGQPWLTRYLSWKRKARQRRS